MSTTLFIKRWRPVALLPGGGQIHLPVLADAARLNRRVRRGANRAGRADASAGWGPSEGMDEPDYCRQLDHQYLVAAAQLCIRADIAVLELLTTMIVFVEAPDVVGPQPGAVGPPARRQAEDVARFSSLRNDAVLAWTAWELARTELLAELRRRDALRRAERAAYAAALAARHPHPDRLPALDGVPDLCVREAPVEPAVLAKMRRRFGSASSTEMTEVRP